MRQKFVARIQHFHPLCSNLCGGDADITDIRDFVRRVHIKRPKHAGGGKQTACENIGFRLIYRLVLDKSAREAVILSQCVSQKDMPELVRHSEPPALPAVCLIENDKPLPPGIER